MKTWYECKVKFLQISENGSEKKVTRILFVDAVSFTDAETRVFNIMAEITRNDFQVMNIKKSNISDFILNSNGSFFYKAKISFIILDEDEGKEKKVNKYLLLAADDLNEAQLYLNRSLSEILSPYVILSISLSPIWDIYPLND
jgi:hypothetical protein